MKTLWLSAGAVALALAAWPAVPADGTHHVFRDDRGRAIHFVSRVDGAPLARYARILRRAVHGDEIERLRIEVVPAARVPGVCATPRAVACHVRRPGRTPRIVIAPGPRAERLLLHEYGHHLDIHIANGARPEPNGTPRWWAARGVASGIRTGSLAAGYGSGWHSAAPELFAEDYARLNGGAGWMIRGHDPPTAAHLRALRADLRDALGDRAAAPRAGRRIIVQRGLLRPGDRSVVPFRTGPRREFLRARMAVTRGRHGRLEARLVCGGRRLSRATVRPGRLVTFARPLPRRSRCRILVAATDGPAVYALRISRSGQR